MWYLGAVAGPMIELTEVQKSYSGQVVLREVSLTVQAGEFVSIIGPSGSGKSTLLNVIGGLSTPDHGQVEVAGSKIGSLSDRELARFRNQRIGFVFQAFNLLDHLTCLENVLLPSYFAPERDPQAEKRADEALDRVGIADRRGSSVAELSGGQRQRVAIARALFAEPELMLADEPTGNLDSQTGREVIQLFSRVVQESGLTLVVVTHEDRVSQAAGRVIHLEDGRITAAGAS